MEYLQSYVETSYYVDEDKKTVVCVIETCNEIERRLNKYELPHDYMGEVFPDVRRYVGKAKCCPEDKWDESYGRKLAEYRAMMKRTKDVNNEVFNYTQELVKKLNLLGQYGIMAEPKHPDIA